MKSNCYSFPIDSVCANAVLYTTVVINTVLMCFTLQWDLHDNKLIFGDDFITEILLILSESILLLFAAVVCFKHYTTVGKMISQFCVFVAVIELLLFDLSRTFKIALNLLVDRGLDRIWDRREPTTTANAPDSAYFFVFFVLLCYFVFKLYTAIIILQFGIVGSCRSTVNEDDIEDNPSSERATVALTPLPTRPLRLTRFAFPPPSPPPPYSENVIDTEIPLHTRPPSLSSPPPYFECVTDTENPPPYSSLLANTLRIQNV